jgi:ketoreductase RED2
VSDRAAIVTGGTSGIGEEIARRLASRGYGVLICSRSGPRAGASLAEEIGGAHLQCDISDPPEAERLIAHALERFGRIDVLVNNAAATERVPWSDLKSNTPEIWHRILATNVVAPYVLVAAAEAALRRSGGCVINIGSLAGVRAVGRSIPYGASKAALHHLTTSLAQVLGPEVRVNAVAPGYIATPWTSDAENASVTEEFVNAAPLKRGGTTSEIADVVEAVVGASFVTGQTIVVDGGVSTSTL